MTETKQNKKFINIKPIFWKGVGQLLWLLAGIGVIVLFGAAMQKKTHQHCSDVKIEITGAEKDVFIDEKDVLDLINSNGNVSGKDLSTIDLKALENAIEKNLWVKNAEMFFDNNQLLHIDIEERTPVARVFTSQGNSFYVDSNALRLPLSEKLSARVPMFTNFPSDKEVLSQSDSMILSSVVKMGEYIIADSFWMAQVAQIDITSHGTFEMIPTIGDQLIELGNADDLDSKFDRLYTFYKQAWLQKGMNAYSKIDVQYNNQVVAVKRGAGNMQGDSAKAMQLMSSLIQQSNATRKDSTQLNLKDNPVKKSPVLKDSVTVNKPVKKINKNVIGVKQNKASNKSLSVSHKPSEAKKPAVKNNQPKAVMQKDQ